jgi:hypothetical protein
MYQKLNSKKNRLINYIYMYYRCPYSNASHKLYIFAISVTTFLHLYRLLHLFLKYLETMTQALRMCVLMKLTRGYQPEKSRVLLVVIWCC